MKVKFAPYQLVEVTVQDHNAEGGRRRFVGEVMSFVTPEDTIMVRRIPGHPGTLEELPITQLAIPSRKYRYVHYAVVKGNGSFPVDMLRYDSCVPVNFTLEEAYSGMKAKLDPATSAPGDDLVVADVSEHRLPRFTKERWRSFLWFVKELRTERIGEERT